MTAVAEFGQYIDDLAKVAGSIAGLVLAVVVASEKIARLIPTNFKCKPLQRIARIFYTIFAVIGLKAPDIAAIKDGKIVTNIEAVAQEVVNQQPETAAAEPK